MHFVCLTRVIVFEDSNLSCRPGVNRHDPRNFCHIDSSLNSYQLSRISVHEHRSIADNPTLCFVRLVRDNVVDECHILSLNPGSISLELESTKDLRRGCLRLVSHGTFEPHKWEIRIRAIRHISGAFSLEEERASLTEYRNLANTIELESLGVPEAREAVAERLCDEFVLARFPVKVHDARPTRNVLYETFRNKVRNFQRVVDWYFGNTENLERPKAVEAILRNYVRRKGDDGGHVTFDGCNKASARAVAGNYEHAIGSGRLPWVDDLTLRNLKHISSIDPAWFMASRLVALRLVNVSVGANLDWNAVAPLFADLRHLRFLRMEGCQLREFPEYLVRHLSPTVRNITLNRNDITELPVALGHLTDLGILCVNDNPNFFGLPWHALPETLGWLEINDTAVVEIPECVGRFQELLYLYAKRCRNLRKIAWSSLPSSLLELKTALPQNLPSGSELSHCTKLTVAKLANTNAHFVHFDIDFLSVKNLERLCFANVDFSVFPDLRTFTRLKKLKFRNCNMNVVEWSMLPSAFFDVAVIENELANLEANGDEENFGRFENFSFLRLDKNCLRRIEQVIALTNLMHLELAHNCVSELPVTFATTLVNLTKLDLRYNWFGPRPENPESDLTAVLWSRLPSKLYELNLCGNEIPELPCCLATLPNLNKVTVEDCSLTHICPKLRMSLFVGRNLDLRTLPFLPESALTLQNWTERHYQLPQIGPMSSEKVLAVYSDRGQFRNQGYIGKNFVKLDSAKLRSVSCRCCVWCNTVPEDAEAVVVEKNVVMDCGLVEAEPTQQEFVMFYPRAWKSRLRSRLCQKCFVERVPIQYSAKKEEPDEKKTKAASGDVCFAVLQNITTHKRNNTRKSRKRAIRMALEEEEEAAEEETISMEVDMGAAEASTSQPVLPQSQTESDSLPSWYVDQCCRFQPITQPVYFPAVPSTSQTLLPPIESLRAPHASHCPQQQNPGLFEVGIPEQYSHWPGSWVLSEPPSDTQTQTPSQQSALFPPLPDSIVLFDPSKSDSALEHL